MLGMTRSDSADHPTALKDLRVRIFADGADVRDIRALAGNPLIKGFTTNPTLMRRAGVADYRAFGREIVPVLGRRPISFEVLSDDFTVMERQAWEIASWGDNVFVKIPVTNTRGESSSTLVGRLVKAGVRVNVTAVMTLEQVERAAEALAGTQPAFVSVFAGRIADTGRDPIPLMRKAVQLLSGYRGVELIWASPREVLNIFHADAVGCHVITATVDILTKLSSVGKDLEQFSRETVHMFHDDARAAGYVLPGAAEAEGAARR